MEGKNTSSENIHKNHRQRMRTRLISNPQSLTDHELLEMILYNSIRQGNTNPQAHQLLNLGKNLRGVLDLNQKQICSVQGLGESTDVLVRLLREFFIRIEKEKLDTDNSRKITRKNIAEKLHKIFYGLNEEHFIMMTVDQNCCLINTHTIASGNESSAVVSLKSIATHALDDNASFVFLAHNHPSGILAPSVEDVDTTKLICEALSVIDVPVIEHYIVTSSSILGIIDKLNLFSRKKNQEKK